MDALTKTSDGKPAAAGTIQRKRGVIVNALDQAVERKLLLTNPAASLSWTAPRTTKTVDKREVVNPTQARALLEAVHDQAPSGAGLVAFFAVMYYSALRPREALNLRKTNLLLPAEGWGELLFDQSCPSAGKAWSDSGTRREQRQLKHRAIGDTRSAPCPPELTQLLHNHLSRYGTDSEGRLFRGIRSGRELEESTYHRVWRKLARPRSRPRNTRHRSHADPMTSAMPQCPRGSTRGYRPPRLLSGQDTALRSCSRSTRSVSLGRMRWPGLGSRPCCAGHSRTLRCNLGTYRAQTTVERWT